MTVQEVIAALASFLPEEIQLVKDAIALLEAPKITEEQAVKDARDVASAGLDVLEKAETTGIK
jgi:hypothetical protein